MSLPATRGSAGSNWLLVLAGRIELTDDGEPWGWLVWVQNSPELSSIEVLFLGDSRIGEPRLALLSRQATPSLSEGLSSLLGGDQQHWRVPD